MIVIRLFPNIAVALVLPVCLLRGAGAEPPDQSRIVDGMMREQAARFEHIDGYTRVQHYSVTSGRFGVTAGMVVRIHRDRVKGKTFEVLSRTGSPVIQSHVFDALVEAEMATSMQGGDLLTRENYSFQLVGEEDFGGRRCYVLETNPKRKDKRLLKGKIWLDTEDFGVVHVEGRPSESLSLWVGKPMIVQDYTKISGFWWATRRNSYMENFLLGKSDLVIDYKDYQFEFRQPPQ